MKLKELFEEWLVFHSKSVKESTTRFTRESVYCFFRKTGVGNLDVQEARSKDFFEAFLKAKQDISFHQVKKALQILERAYNYALILEKVTRNPITIVSKQFPTLPRYGRKRYRHYKAEELNKFFIDFKKINILTFSSVQTRLGIELLLRTVLRPRELLNLEKKDIDFKCRVITVPAKKMKTNKEFKVYLSKQSVAVLKILFQVNPNSKYLFRREKKDIPPVPSIFSGFLHTKKIGTSAHGFRYNFSTIAHESGLFSIDAIELSLSHSIRGTRGLYNEARYIRERKKLSQWYSDKIDKIAKVKRRKGESYSPLFISKKEIKRLKSKKSLK